MMNRIERDFVSILNVLSLLREKPMTYEEIWKSGYLKTLNQLNFALRRLKQAGCIEKIKTINMYFILGYGITLLSFYPTWRPLQVEVLDVAVSIGEERHEDSKVNRSRHRHYPV